MPKAPAQDMRDLLVKTERDTFKISVPADWKITYSPEGDRFNGRGTLRFYEAETKQRAVFTGVVTFRDASIPVLRLVRSKSGSESWEIDSEGNQTSTKTVRVDESWGQD